jgi:hypothetical protein
MAKKLDPNKELTSWEEISYSNMVEHHALLSLLLEKISLPKRNIWTG